MCARVFQKMPVSKRQNLGLVQSGLGTRVACSVNGSRAAAASSHQAFEMLVNPSSAGLHEQSLLTAEIRANSVRSQVNSCKISR